MSDEIVFLEGAGNARPCHYCKSTHINLVDEYADMDVVIYTYTCAECGALAQEHYKIDGTSWMPPTDKEKQ